MTDELETLKAITEIIRKARADLAEDLARLDELDVSRIVPRDYKEGEQ